MRPDITWWFGSQCAAVVDAKHKRTSPSGYSTADTHQMFGYCTRLGLRRGFLVYTDLDGGQPGTGVIRNAGIEIIATLVDISGSIAKMEASVAELAGLIVGPPVRGLALSNLTCGNAVPSPVAA